MFILFLSLLLKVAWPIPHGSCTTEIYNYLISHNFRYKNVIQVEEFAAFLCLISFGVGLLVGHS